MDDGKKSMRIPAIAAVIVLTVFAIAAISVGVHAHIAHKAEKAEMKAGTFAESLADTLQSRGRQHVTDQFWNNYKYRDENGRLKVYDGLMFSLVDDYDSYGPSDGHFRIIGKNKGVKIPREGDTQRYTVLGTGYRGSSYDVQISYDPSDYSGKSVKDARAYNVNDFPDTSALSGDSTVVVNPEGPYVTYDKDEKGSYEYDDETDSFKSSHSSMEESAVDEFYGKYATFYNDACELVNDAFRKAGVDSAHRIRVSDFYSQGDRENKKKDMRSLIARETVIHAEGEKNDISVTSDVLFRLTDSSQLGNPQNIIAAIPSVLAGATVAQPAADAADSAAEQETVAGAEGQEQGQTAGQSDDQTDQAGGSTSQDAGSAAVPISQEQINSLTGTLSAQIQDLWQKTSSAPELTVQYKVYSSDSSFNNLENVYLMYCPLEKGKWKSDTVDVDISDIKDLYNSGNKLDVYVVPQLGLLATDKMPYDSIQASDYISPKITGARAHYNGQGGLSGDVTSISSYGSLFDMTRIRINYLRGWLDKIAAADMKDDVVAKSGSQDVTYKLTVKVYRASDGSFPEKDRLAVKSVVCS